MSIRRRFGGRRAARGDRGMILILFALSITAVAAVAALVLGGSTGYSASRSSQNAADAAAMATTTEMRAAQRAGTVLAAENVYAVAVDVASENGADSDAVVCEVVDPEYALGRAESDVIGPCYRSPQWWAKYDDGDPLTPAPTSPVHEFDARAGGIRITVQETRDVPFGFFVEGEDITARSRATATAQPPTEGRSPFMVCASLTAIGHPQPPLLGDPAYPPWIVNPAAVGRSFVLWGSEMKDEGRDCGNGIDEISAWRGLVNIDSFASYPLPPASPDPANDADWWRIKTGNKSGHVEDLLVDPGACTLVAEQNVLDIVPPCTLAVPLCTHSNNAEGSSYRLHCVSMAMFEITHVNKGSGGPVPCHTNTNNIICGTMLGSAILTGGQGTTGVQDPNAIAILKLVE